MKRDMDLVRAILFHIEQSDDFGAGGYGMVSAGDFCNDQQIVNSHMQLLANGELVEVVSWLANATPLIRGLTWKGHDLLDSVRDPEIWRKTKEGANAAGGYTAELLGDLAKGLIKTQIKKLTGVEI